MSERLRPCVGQCRHRHTHVVQDVVAVAGRAVAAEALPPALLVVGEHRRDHVAEVAHQHHLARAGIQLQHQLGHRVGAVLLHEVGGVRPPLRGRHLACRGARCAAARRLPARRSPWRRATGRAPGRGSGGGAASARPATTRRRSSPSAPAGGDSSAGSESARKTPIQYVATRGSYSNGRYATISGWAASMRTTAVEPVRPSVVSRSGCRRGSKELRSGARVPRTSASGSRVPSSSRTSICSSNRGSSARALSVPKNPLRSASGRPGWAAATSGRSISTGSRRSRTPSRSTSTEAAGDCAPDHPAPQVERVRVGGRAGLRGVERKARQLRRPAGRAAPR